jgi:hypothetical protein
MERMAHARRSFDERGCFMRRICVPACPFAAISLAALFGLLLAACGGSSPATPPPPPTATTGPTVVPTATATAAAATLPTATQGAPPSPTPAPVTPVAGTAGIATVVPGSVGAGGPPAQGCGMVRMQGPTTVGGPAALQAEECFWQAYQQCRTAGTELLVTQMGVDTLTTRGFRLDNTRGGCTIRVTEEVRLIPRGQTAKAYPCASLTREANGALHFLSCGNGGDLIVPPPTAP